MSETDLRATLRDWTSALPSTDGRAVAVRRRVRRRRQLLATGSAVTALAAAVLVVAFGPWAAKPSKLDVPPVKRPSPVVSLPSFAHAVQGGVVEGQASGLAGQSRTISVSWPAKNRLAILYLCGRPGGAVDDTASIGIEVAGVDRLDAPCIAGQLTNLVLDGSRLSTIPAAWSVDVVVTTSGSAGPWAVAVVNTDPHWAQEPVLAAKKLGSRTLATSFRGGMTGSETFRVDSSDDDPVFVLECSQAGELVLLLNGNQIGAANCPDSAYSTSLVEIPRADLIGDGWVVGQSVTLALHGPGGNWGFAGLLVYGR